MNLGEKLKYLRSKKNLTADSFGKRLGFGETAAVRISQYENNERVPRSDLQNRIASELGVDCRMLFGAGDDEKAELIRNFMWLDEMDEQSILFTVQDGEVYVRIKGLENVMKQWALRRLMSRNHKNLDIKSTDFRMKDALFLYDSDLLHNHGFYSHKVKEESSGEKYKDPGYETDVKDFRDPDDEGILYDNLD